MPVAPEIEKLLPAFNAQPPMHQVPLPLLRRTRERINAADFQPVGSVEDRSFTGPGGPIPLRLYAPERSEGRLPLVLVFHGGGFVFGGIDGYYDTSAGCCAPVCAAGSFQSATGLLRKTSSPLRRTTALQRFNGLPGMPTR